MKRLVVLTGVATLAGGAAWAGELEPNLKARLELAQPNEIVSTLVYLSHQANTAQLVGEMTRERATIQQRHEGVVRSLMAVADATQGPLLAELGRGVQRGTIDSFTPFWITNAVRVDATPAEIVAISRRNDVEMVFINYPIELIEPVAKSDDAGGPRADGEIEPGVIAVRAPEVWALGYDGTGVTVSSLDTGVDGNHPALADRWAGVADARYAGHPEWAWFDPVTNTTFPQAFGDHGTHTMGTVCGGAPGDQIGVAPGAQWIHAAVIDRVSIERTAADAILAFQWSADPDGDPNTVWDVPATSSNSWGLGDFHGYPDCDDLFWSSLDNLEAAGCTVIFSAGNEGFGGLRRPSDRATDEWRTHAVAAVDGNNPSWPIAGFSSRGPTNCTPSGQPAIKPDISAPGVDVRSSVSGNGYAFFSGTSMASPHVNGVIALMKEANPELTPEEAKQIVYETAFDLGNPGEDNDYGYGMIDAYEAVQLALALATISFDFPEGLPELVSPDGGTTVRMEVLPSLKVQPEPGTGKFYYSDGGPFTEVTMNEISPNVYEATFPPFLCGTDVQFYFSAETTKGEVEYSPRRAPDETYSSLAGQGIDVSLSDDFNADSGWRIQYQNLTDGRWERVIPSTGGRLGEPEEDFDGSGHAFVTDDDYGDDVDGGPSTLLSPVFAVDDGIPAINYAYWLTSRDGTLDNMTVRVSNDGGNTWHDVASHGDGNGWRSASFNVLDFVAPTTQMKMRFDVTDNPDDSRTEGAIDAFSVSTLFCDRLELTLPDFNAGQPATLEAANATPGADVHFVYSLAGRGGVFVPALDVVLDLAAPQLAGSATADANGNASLTSNIPPAARGRTVWVQAAEQGRKSTVDSRIVN